MWPSRRRPDYGGLGAHLAPTPLRAEPGESDRGPCTLEGLETQGHLAHFEKFTKRDRAASEITFCFDSLTESRGENIFKN